MNSSCRLLFRTARRFCVLAAALSAVAQACALTNLNVRLVSNAKPSVNPVSYGDVWAEGDLACLGVWLNYSTYNYGVGIYSISNPAAPVLLSIKVPLTGSLVVISEVPDEVIVPLTFQAA